MYVILDYESGVPIYEQIKTGICRQIMSGELTEGNALPSIRTFAKGLKIGINTAKRAYDDLCAEGLLYSVQGKGVFVAKCDRDKADVYALNELHAKLADVAACAEKNAVGKEKMKEILKEFWENNYERNRD